MEPVKETKRRGRRTRDEIEAARGETLAREVARLSLSQLAAFAAALPEEEAAFIASKIGSEARGS